MVNFTKDNVRVAVVSVAFNSMDEIPAMSETLPEWTSLQLVDNGPNDGLRDWALSNEVPIAVPSENVGFGEGCNIGAKAMPDADFYFFLNPDARLEKGTIEAFLDAAERYPEASAFGPEIRKPSGKPVSLRPSKLLKLKPGQKRKSFPANDTQVPTLSGAALFVRAEAFWRVGGFDPGIFMYFEDDDLTLRLADKAGPLWYIPEAQVVHAGDSSSPGSADLARFKGYHYARSQIYMFKKLGQNASFIRGLASSLRRCVSVKMLSSPESRSYALGRVAGSWSMRASGA